MAEVAAELTTGLADLPPVERRAMTICATQAE
jgi:hypothetical protein